MIRGARSRRAVSPVLATLLMIAVAVSMSVILFVWSQNFLASTSEAASSQQQAQNVAAQSSIAIESVQFTNALASDGNRVDEDDDGSVETTEGLRKAIKITVRNVGASKVTISQAYVGTSAYEMTAYPTYKAVKNPSDTTGLTQIGQDSSAGKWYVTSTAVTAKSPDWDNGEGYQGSITTIYARYLTDDSSPPAKNNYYVQQNTGVAIAYVFDSSWNPSTDGELEPQGFAVIYLYLSNAWSAGETYYIRVTTTVGTFADVTVTAPTS